MAEMGLSARTRGKTGALRGRWRAQCGTARPTIHGLTNSRICRTNRCLWSVYLMHRSAFLSSAARPAFSPHQSRSWRAR